jgi:hypothetical protein
MEKAKIISLIVIVNLILWGCAPVIPPVRKGKVPSQEIIRPELRRLTDEEFLDFIQRKAFAFFWNEANPQTGLIRDRANNFFQDDNKIASVASVGFGLTAIPIAHKRGWITYDQAYKRVLTTLKFFKQNMGENHGFYYHFVHLDTGKPTVGSEISSIDTALFLAGALFCGQYFKGTEVEKIAIELYKRVEWPWMLNKGSTFCMSYKKRGGFSSERYNHYNETMILYLLALASPTHPVSADIWHEIYRPIRTYKNYTLIAYPSLFAHQYSHFWVDFRDKSDDYADYFENSVKATQANRKFCIEMEKKFKTYGANSWGLTACDGPSGYKAYGALPSVFKPTHDGTIAPTAAGGSMQFTPDISLACLKNIYETQKENLWGRYGFSDAFNLDKNWYAKDVIGIDQGAILLSIENYRTGFVWETFMKLPYIQKALKLAGFKKGSKEVIRPPVPVYEAKRSVHYMIIDGNLDEWDKGNKINLTSAKNLDYGAVTDSKKDLLADFYFSWDKDFLYLAALVIDNELVNPYSGYYLYKGDIIELFLDPEANGFFWGNKRDFQIGLAPVSKEGKPATFSWFQRLKPLFSQIDMAVKKLKINNQNAYSIEAAISWDFLKIEPQAGKTIGVSVAVHDLDKKDSTPQCKLNWHFIEDFSEDGEGFELAKIRLSL